MLDDKLIGVLEKKNAIRILIELKLKPGMTKRDVVKTENGGNDRTRFLRINDLIEADLVEVEQKPEYHNKMHLYLTKRGQMVVYYLEKMLTE